MQNNLASVVKTQPSMNMSFEGHPFNGDTFLLEKIKDVITNNNIDIIVETGTYQGDTTIAFSKLSKTVHTIEINDDLFEYSLKRFIQEGIKNISIYNGSSEKLLNDTIIPIISPKSKVLFYLDAHWGNFCPLLDELNVISKSKIQPTIVIHDFKVPNKEELGYDNYNGQPFEWSWIEPNIKTIYGNNNFVVEYNNESNGAKRGVIFIYPKTNKKHKK